MSDTFSVRMPPLKHRHLVCGFLAGEATRYMKLAEEAVTVPTREIYLARAELAVLHIQRFQPERLPVLGVDLGTEVTPEPSSFDYCNGGEPDTDRAPSTRSLDWEIDETSTLRS